MKFSESWLREWVNPKINRNELCAKLTMAGLEIEEVAKDGEEFLIDVSITPNRGDCLSIRGMAYEVAALTQTPLNELKIPEIKSVINDTIPVTIKAAEDCPCYIGRIIRQVKANTPTPTWLSERLRHANMKSISAIVDVMNYVMLELGQPMHAFSLDQLNGGIDVRKARAGEKIKLLDDSEVELDAEALVIADQKEAVAIAGVMGGLDSAVTMQTQDVFLESAYFKPGSIARTSRFYTINSDSSYRFERAIDPALQRMAIERATQLLLEIVGGQPGPIIEVSEEKYLPQAATINLRKDRISKILGCEIADAEVEKIFQHLQFPCSKTATGWQVTAPPRRSDVRIEVDLIEEIARLHGYDKIPCNNPVGTMQISNSIENKILPQTLRRALSDLGYHEVVTYSFVDKKLQSLFDPQQSAKELMNPMTAEMDVMRTNLWPGLVNTLLYNQNRQQSCIRIFETGLRYVQNGDELLQDRMLAGLISGPAQPEQWGMPKRAADFFDVKGDLQNLFNLTHASDEFTFEAFAHPALHPGQTAAVFRKGVKIGILGALHPAIIQALKIEGKVFVFELFLAELEAMRALKASEVSRFPEIRRDLALVLDQSVPAMALQDTIRQEAGDLLKQVDIFDVYQGKGIEAGRKSVALALTLQHSSRTLVDEEVIDIVERVIVALKGRFNAELRG